MRLLLTAFGPFPGCPVNPTERLAAHLSAPLARATGWEVDVCTLPVAWDGVAGFVDAVAAEVAAAPDDWAGWLALGVAARRSLVCVERFAHNHAGGKQDASGLAAPAAELCEAAPDRREGRLHRPPFEGVVAGLRTLWPVTYSDDAGRYLCNALFYRMLHRLDALLRAQAPLGFIHIPHVRGLSTAADDPAAISEEAAASSLERLLTGFCRAAAAPAVS